MITKFRYYQIIVGFLLLNLSFSLDPNDVLFLRPGDDNGIDGIGAGGHNQEDYFFELGTGNENNRGLFPSIFNLATNAIITTNATCGKKGTESFCKLVEHVFNRTPQCDVCDDNHPGKRHPIEYAVDGTNRWWQSPTLATGLEYEWVTIKLDLRQQYQVAYVIIKAAIAPRPGNWILERSLDDQEWKPWQYYATTDEECQRIYGVSALPGGVHKVERDDQVTCTSWYSRLDPLEDGEIHTSLVNGRPGIDGPSLALQEFTKARYIRLRFQRLKTLNSDLIYITRRPFTIDESVTRRYFYAIRDISIGGQCICYGHAEHCPADPSTGQLRCECKHNTCGESCDECCPLFNQKPWQHGTTTQQHACEPCQCFNHADRCEYSEDIANRRLSVTPDGLYEGGGVCKDCKHNTQGINCQECKDTYYRPGGMSHYLPDACRSCDCNPVGSIDTVCVKDDTLTSDDLKPGYCRCKVGFGGSRCDSCALGFRNYPICDPCPCHRAGSANFATCDSTCVCKRNVEGEFCDKCKIGHFNLDEDNPDGCTPCFCFGMTNECKESVWGKDIIRDMKGWNLTDHHIIRDVQLPYSPSDLALTVNVKEIPDRSLFYLKAPPAYRNNLLASYNGDLKYFVYYVIEGGGVPMNLPDVIIRGNGVMLELHSRKVFMEKENVSVSLRLHERAEWYDRVTGRPVDKTQFMNVLANVDTFLIKAIYHQTQLQASIYSISLETAKENSLNEAFASVEQCSCPPNFVGLSCETCANGYRRVENILYKGTCELCLCNEHSQKCDPYTGHCLECQHNTMGPRCEHCIDGHYGNPSLKNSAGACKKCGCPLTDAKNNFSPTCMLASDLSMDDYICTGCPPGHIGNKCESCSEGYFGDPMVPGNYCQSCQCNNNIDMAAIGNCDRKTGKCLKCIGNTEGWNCEKCKPDHFGNALKKTCRNCNCNMFGSASTQCDVNTGECQCKEHYIGIRCERCQDGFGDVDNGCPVCNCSKMGSHLDRCDPKSGQCQCKPGVFGKHCDTCITGYFGFSESGCRYCGCFAAGSLEEGKCDTVTGQCLCKPNVGGQMCSVCDVGFFNITSGVGCLSCACHNEGADDKTCDPITGKCRCKYGVTGLKCDKCDSNFYGLSVEGCKKCSICPAVGHVCDPVTGECVCPQFTVGEKCESCVADTWNYDPYKGCEPCACDSAGSVGADCVLKTGQCVCRSGYTGQKCNQCTPGHYKFPSCLECGCFVDGTDPSSCSAEFGCTCNDQGQCPCKKNVVKEKCNDCEPNSFNLEADNPKGCIECFCFKQINDFCVQSSYVWQQLGAEPRTAFFTKPYTYWEKIKGLQVLPAEPPTFNSYPTDYTPLYWPLPVHFLGDKVTSYNGNLRFRITNTNGNYLEGAVRPDHRFFEHYPMVVLVGNHRIILEHFKKNRDISDSGVYLVKFREDLWKARHNPEIPVTRQTFMVALQNVQALYVRATYIDRVGEANLNDLTLDVGVSNSTVESGTAFGVEQCECNKGYAGLSCQHPAVGYCRKKRPNYLDSENDLDLIGWSEECSCNKHSDLCDPETCRCTDCQHNTAGDFCERCSVGYYGDAKLGTSEDCKKCACPSESHSFSKSCYPVNYGEGYVCDACQVGHSGSYCENCIVGYYGEPNLDKQACRLCQCNRYGSIMPHICDTKNGQCTCRPGVTGRDCSDCQPRHALIGADCRSCDQGCTKELMSLVDDLETNLEGYNFTGLVPAPWGHLSSIENQTQAMRKQLEDVKKGESDAKELLTQLGDSKKHLKNAQSLFKLANFVDEKIDESNRAMKTLTDESDKLSKEINDLFNKIRNIHDLLKRYTVSGSADRLVPTNVDQWLLEATDLLKEMQKNTDYLEKRYNLAEQSLLDTSKLLIDVNSKQFNDTTLKSLKLKLDDINKRLLDIKHYVWEDVRKNATNTERILKITEKMLNEFHRITTQIAEDKKSCDDLLDDGRNKLAGAQLALLDIHEHYDTTNNTLLEQLKNATDQCEMHANHLSYWLPKYKEEHLLPSQKHVEDLEVNAAKLHDTFAPFKLQAALPVRASEAYANIKQAIESAALAAKLAKEASDITYGEVITDVGDSIVFRASVSVNKSNDLLQAAQGLQTDELNNNLNGFKTRLTQVNEKSINTRKSISEMDPRFTKFDDISDEVEIIEKDAKEQKIKADALLNRTITLAESAQQLVGKVKDLSAIGSQSLTNITSQTQKAVEGVAKATEQLVELQNQAEKNKDKLDDVEHSLAFLKEKIKEAREKASKIKISVQSVEPETCVRSYLSPAAPSPSNTLHIEYRPTDDVADSLLFITKTKETRIQPSEFLALELYKQNIKFVWDVGSDVQNQPGKVRQILLTQRIAAFAKKDYQSWYHIDVERKGTYVNLTVSVPAKDTTDTSIPRSHSIQMQADDSNMIIFNTMPGDTKVSLGIDRIDLPAEGLQSHQFKGTIGDITFDGYTLPLWNFVEDSDTCKGYYSSYPETIVDQSYLFADGYAQIPSSGTYKTQLTQLQMKFSTYSENGLLYFRGNPEKKDFFSLELDEGRLKTQFYLGGPSKLTLFSDELYNDGKRYKVQITRNGLQVTMIITGVETKEMTATIPGTFTGLEADFDHFFGGVPESYPRTEFKNFNVMWKGFYGCITEVKEKDAWLNFLAANKTLNVQPGCTYFGDGPSDVLVTTDKVLTLQGNGYFVVSGVELGPSSSLSVNFRSSRRSGLLFYQSSQVATTRRRRQTDGHGEGFFLAYIYECVIAFTIGGATGKEPLTLQTLTNICDGRLHTLFIKRKDNMVSLFVDDNKLTVISKPFPNNDVIGSTKGQLFLGGLGPVGRPTNELPVYTPFTGCLSDIYWNYKRLVLIPQRLGNATLGICVESSYARMDRGLNMQGTEPVLDDDSSNSLLDSELKNGRILFDSLPVSYKEDYTGSSREDSDSPITSTTKKIRPKITKKITTQMLTTTSEPSSQTPDISKASCVSSVYSDPIQAGYLFGLKMESFSAVSFKKNYNITDLSISMQFRTEEPTGTLIAWPNKNFENFLFVLLEEGIIYLRLKVSRMKGVLEMRSDANRLFDDGKWHSLSLLKNDDNLSLQIDDQEMFKDKIPKKWSLKRSRGGLMIGGVRKSIAKKFDINYESFSGCIKDFHFDGVPTSLEKITRGTEPCRATPSVGVYFKVANGTVKFENYPLDYVMKITTEFRADNVADGTILTLVNKVMPTMQTYMFLRLKNGQVTLHAGCLSGFSCATFNFAVESVSLCDNNWHSLTVSFALDKLTIKLDTNEHGPIAFPNEFYQMFSSWKGDLFLGKIPHDLMINDEPALTGCIRNVKINEQEVDFTKSNENTLAVFNECPF